MIFFILTSFREGAKVLLGPPERALEATVCDRAEQYLSQTLFCAADVSVKM